MIVGRFDFEAFDPDRFCERMEPMSPHIAVKTLRKGRFHTKTDAVLLPGVRLARTRSCNFHVRSDPGRGYSSITLTLSSAVEIVEQHGAQSFGPENAYVLRDDRPFDLRSADAVVLIVNFDTAQLQKFASELQSFPVDYGPRLELTTPSGRALQRQAMSLWSEAWRAGPITRSPLALREAADSLTTQFLTGIAAAELEDGSETERESTRTGILRAEDWIPAHLTEPISRADLCAVSGLNARTLSRGFQRRHGMGPMAFVRERRLDQIHRLLLAAGPGEVEVSGVALDYGFYHLSRFAAHYRRAFGELPSETLNT
jgi:AraC-like DNA-binding protein